MHFDDNTETVRFKLDLSDEGRQQMSDELEQAPTYAVKMVPGDGGTVITAFTNKGSQAVSTATTLRCHSLQKKLSIPALSDDTSSGSRYERLDVLGEGGTGHVYEMLDHNIKRKVAVKLLKGSSSASDIDGFVREGILAAELEHPNIIPIYDMDVDDEGRVFLSMKKVAGEHLLTLVKNDALSLADLLAVILKVCDALSYAHSQNRVHQDVKPENIMVGEYGEVFLIDWGAGSELDEDMQLSPVYMSPQQAVGEPAAPADDIYCLGASLFHMLTKRFPTNADTIDALWERKVEGEIDLPTEEEQASIPPALLAIALKAMEVSVADRYQSIAEFAEDIKAYQNGFATTAEDAGAITLFKLLMKRRWKEILLAHAVLLVVAGFGTKYYLDIHRASLAKLEAELTAANLELEKREQWNLLFTADFTKPGGVGPEIAGYEDITSDPGGIPLGFRSQRSDLRTSKPLHSEPKIVITFVSDNVPRLELFIRNRYEESVRCLSISETVGFSSIGPDWDNVFGGNKPVRSIIRPGKQNTLGLWLRNGTWYADLNGENIMTCYDPDLDFLQHGVIFSLGRWIHIDELRIQSISLYSRQAPVVVSILEPGKAFYREGNFAAAREWFLRQVDSASDSGVVDETAYLAAVANDSAGIENRIREFQAIADSDSPFRIKALHQIVILSSKTTELERTLDNLEKVTVEAPELNTYGRVWPSLQRQLMTKSPETRHQLISRVAKLPLTGLSLSDCELHELPKMNKTLQNLHISRNPIQDFSALRGMPLKSLFADRTEVKDLSPLKGMNLKQLHLRESAIHDLSALEGMSLDQLVVKNSNATIDLNTLKNATILKPIFDGSPLKNLEGLSKTQAVHLRLRGCGLSNLDFAEGLKLNIVDAVHNSISDISGLKGQRLKYLTLNNNSIRDLTPFKTFEVMGSLDLSNNPIEDLSPLAGQPLKGLNISNTKVTDLSDLRQLKNLQYLAFYGDGNSPAPDLTALERCSFSRLSLQRQNLENIAPLAKCTLTGDLNLSYNPISDLSPLSGQQLKNITLMNTQVTDLSPLASLTQLQAFSVGSSDPEIPSSLNDIRAVCTGDVQELHITNCSVRDISPLTKCKQLWRLDLSGNPLETIAPLEGLGVKALHLSDTRVKDYSPLHELKMLRVLTINGRSSDKPGKLSDLSDFPGLVLTHLSLKNNSISDIKPLRTTTVTFKLDLSGNPISDLSPLEKHPVRKLDISNTKVTDLSFIRTMPNLEELTIKGLSLDDASEQLLKEISWLSVTRD